MDLSIGIIMARGRAGVGAADEIEANIVLRSHCKDTFLEHQPSSAAEPLCRHCWRWCDWSKTPIVLAAMGVGCGVGFTADKVSIQIEAWEAQRQTANWIEWNKRLRIDIADGRDIYLN